MVIALQAKTIDSIWDQPFFDISISHIFCIHAKCTGVNDEF